MYDLSDEAVKQIQAELEAIQKPYLRQAVHTKYSSNAPLDLLSQLNYHKEAIALTERTIRGEITEAQWREALKPLLVSLNIFCDFLGSVIKQRRIFLCHASEDKSKVSELYHQLKAAGYHPWLDKYDLLPGQNWRRELDELLLILIVLS